MDYTGYVVEAGVDWLTLRARDPIRATALRQWAEEKLQAEVRLGNKSRGWAWYGFVGASAGAVRWGVGDRGVVCCVSGSVAHSSFRAAQAYAETVTRIDFCATVRCEPPQLGISQDAYTQALAAYKASGNAPKPSLWVGSEGGITCYLGDRTSSYFGRIYNKELESGNVAYTACWRYEVEVKQPAANEVAIRAALSADVVAFAAGYVWGWWDERHVAPSYHSETAYLEATGTRHNSGAAVSLGWLRQAVAPTVRKLMLLGHTADVYDALGLPL